MELLYTDLVALSSRQWAFSVEDSKGNLHRFRGVAFPYKFAVGQSTITHILWEIFEGDVIPPSADWNTDAYSFEEAHRKMLDAIQFSLMTEAQLVEYLGSLPRATPIPPLPFDGKL